MTKQEADVEEKLYALISVSLVCGVMLRLQRSSGKLVGYVRFLLF